MGIGWGLRLLTLASLWLTVFGRNLYWIMGTWYLPKLLSAWICHAYDRRKPRPFLLSCLLLAGLFTASIANVAIKGTMGYEYLSTITLSQMSIVV